MHALPTHSLTTCYLCAQKAFGELASLRVLYLQHNELKTLPDSVGSLRSLQLVDLSFNQLKTLPKSIRNWEELQWLNLQRYSDRE